MPVTTDKKAEPLTKKRLARRVGEARLEAEAAKRLLAETETELRLHAHSSEFKQVFTLLESVRATMERLGEALPARLGVSVDQAADRLNVSQPTVRKWLKRGYLEALPDVKPVEIHGESVLEMQDVLGRVREHFGGGDSTRAIAAYLHDQEILDGDDFRRGIEDARAGRVVTLAE